MLEDPPRICQALVDAAHSVELDAQTLLELFIALGDAEDDDVANAATICIGHLARVRRTIDVVRARAALEERARASRTRLTARHALSDVEMFAK